MPWFQLKDLAKRHGIIALSSNYTLYADISNRVMRLLSQYSPDQEIYSIDESFLDLTGMAKSSNPDSSNSDSLTEYAQTIRGTIKRCVGIPVCVGIAPSKTLAKLANHVAKITGAATLEPDKMVSRFTSDLWKLAQDGGLTLSRCVRQLLRAQLLTTERPFSTVQLLSLAHRICHASGTRGLRNTEI